MELLRYLWDTKKCKGDTPHSVHEDDLARLRKNPKKNIGATCTKCGYDLMLEPYYEEGKLRCLIIEI